MTAEIGSPVWWLTSIIVGTVIALLAELLRTGILRFAGRYSRRLREENEERERRVLQSIEAVRGDPGLQQWVHFEIIRMRVEEVKNVIVTFASLGLAMFLMLFRATTGFLSLVPAAWAVLVVGGLGIFAAIEVGRAGRRAKEYREILERAGFSGREVL